jgi:hypothetical protein
VTCQTIGSRGLLHCMSQFLAQSGLTEMFCYLAASGGKADTMDGLKFGRPVVRMMGDQTM